MAFLSGLGLALSLVFGCLLLALFAELYYLLWWKKQRITSCNSSRIEEDYSNHTKEMFYLFCWDKPSSTTNSNPITQNNPTINSQNEQDLELGLENSSSGSKDVVFKSLGEESIESELMRLHNLAGPPRFLFTIKEESKEDLESEDYCRSRKGSRTRSLGDLIVALESQTPFMLSPMSSPNVLLGLNNNYSNPLFESSVEAELFRLRSSPPPKFKFLRDAEEKLYRKLLEEAHNNKNNNGILQEGILDNSHTSTTSIEDDENGDGCLVKSSKVVMMSNCSSQVLPLVSSPIDNNNDAPPLSEKKSSLH